MSMNSKPIQLSIILTTHIPEKVMESILSSIGKVESPATEIIIIDDAAGEEINNKLVTLIREAPNESIFLYDHDRPLGRGNSLNEAIAQSTGKFVWIPDHVNRFNENLFRDAIRRFSSDPAAFWVLDYQLPGSSERWIKDAEDGSLPNDSCFVWNRNAIAPQKFFLNPFLTKHHCAELALRLHEKNAWRHTDPFFVVYKEDFIPVSGNNLLEFYLSVYKTETDQDIKRSIAEKLGELRSDEETEQATLGYLDQARIFLEQGDPGRSLDLINKFLQQNPSHEDALHIKIASLERLRRHVEAAELKHSLKNRDLLPPEQAELFIPEEKEKAPPQPSIEDLSISVVIPTTGHGRKLLEQCLHTLQNHADARTTELIVIDNASIDDTFEYLTQLQEKNFLNIKVITNEENAGFGASINAGVKAAAGEKVLVLHSDTRITANTIPELSRALDETPSAALAAPLIDETKIDEQKADNEYDNRLLTIDQADSCCFMIRKDLPVQFDEDYGLAFYEMDDFCKQLQNEDFKIILSSSTIVSHSTRSVSDMMGLTLVPELKWRNRERFAEKWLEKPVYKIPQQGSPADKLEALGVPINPESPDPEWIEAVNNFLTDEVKTEILRSNLTSYELITIVSSLMMADQRELMRTLEDRLDNAELPVPMLVLLIHYYYGKNIYSRCKHYIEMAEARHPVFDLYKLRIAIADKETDTSIPLLNKLIKSYPSSPDLLNLTGLLYRQNGDEDEAKSFLAMANQLDPKRFSAEEAAFEIKY